MARRDVLITMKDGGEGIRYPDARVELDGTNRWFIVWREGSSKELALHRFDLVDVIEIVSAEGEGTDEPDP